MSQADIVRELLALDDQYEGIAGHNAFLYCTDTSGEPVYVFTGHRTMSSPEAALAHMRTLMHDLTTQLSGSE